MPETLRLQDPSVTFDIEWVSGGYPDLAVDCPSVIQVVQALRALHAQEPLASFEFKLKPNGKFKYTFTAVDGRVWLQEIDIPNTGEESMDWNISAKWAKSEFEIHRPLRDHCVDLAKTCGVTQIKCEWV